MVKTSGSFALVCRDMVVELSVLRWTNVIDSRITQNGLVQKSNVIIRVRGEGDS